MTDLALPGVVYARANWGRWIGDCPAPSCASALTLPTAGWQIDPFQCWDCGYVAEQIIWPPDVPAIEALLSMRPDERNRNWEPGETLVELMLENAAHGVLPAEWTAGAGELMRTADERVVGGLLLAALPARAPAAVGA